MKWQSIIANRSFFSYEVICFGKGIPGVDDSDGITEYKP